MLSSRPYPYSNELEFYRRSEGGLRMPLGQNSPLVDHYDTASQLSRRTTPSSDADKSGVAPRKRVPVACERCRKRKIKCSGDQGGGCSNCHQAGVSNCQFLRVQSIGAAEIMQQRAMYSRSGYPLRYQPYPSYNSPYRSCYASSPSSSSPSVHSTYQNVQPGVDYGSYGAPSHNLSWSRSNSYSSAYSPYETEATSPYTSQPPSFILPNTDPMSNGNPYLVYPYSTKSHSSPSWQEQPASAIPSQAASQVMAAGYALPSSDALMAYNGTHNTANTTLRTDQSLPYQTLGTQQPPALSSDRTLPNPSGRSYLPSGIASVDRSTLDGLPLSTLSHRSSLGSSLGWQTDTASSSSHLSSQTSCSSNGCSQDFGTGRGPGHRDSTDLGYNYLGYSNSPQPSHPTDTLGTIISDGHAAQPLLSSAGPEIGSQRCRTISNEGQHDSPSATASSTYGYTGVTVAQTSKIRTASGQLSNGTTYAQARPSISRKEAGTERCTADCTGYQTGSNRASIASINNLSNY